MANADAGERWTLTVPEAARGLRISRTLAYQMVRSGELSTIRMGRRLLVPRAALNHLLTAKAHPAAESTNELAA
jgi:excisionase family DNA binding protein